MPVTKHDHVYHAPKSTPPKPEQWVLDGWARQHESEGSGKHFKISSPQWHEAEPGRDFVVEAGAWEEQERGYWVITSQAEG